MSGHAERHQAHGGGAKTLARRHDVRRILAWVLLANLAAIAAKLYVGVRSGSIAVLGDAAHSGIDAVNNVVGLAAMRLAAAPPDEQHPYGHGKFETLAALAVAAFLSITCFELLESAVRRLLSGGSPPNIQPMMLAVLAGTMMLNGAVAWSENRASKRLSSPMLAADARHTASDVVVSAAVLVGVGLMAVFRWENADAVLAIFVAIVVAYSGYQILKDTIPVLVDQRAIDPAEIGSVAASISGVRGTSQIRSRGKPGDGFAELTIHVGREETVVTAHEIADEVEKGIAAQLDFVAVTVHVEPEGSRREET